MRQRSDGRAALRALGKMRERRRRCAHHDAPHIHLTLDGKHEDTHAAP
jgi:hypothetical protein